MKNSKILLTVGIILSSVVLAIIGWAVLPETLVLQVSMSGGAGTTLPKLAGLAIPFLLSIVFSVLYYLYKNKKYLLTSVVGLIVYLLIFLMN